MDDTFSEMKLISLTDKDKYQFFLFIDDFKNSTEKNWSIQKGESFDDYIKRLNDDFLGINLPNNLVPCAHYFMVDSNGEIFGLIKIRLKLTESLKKFGGNIGYVIKPSSRKKGLGSKMLSLALIKCKENKLDEVILTCDSDNYASINVIEKNNGVLDSEYAYGEKNTMIRKYRIKL